MIPEPTQGTETSHYLEEEKTTVIPQVAASESGEAQTREFTLWGSRTVVVSFFLVERVRNARPKKVKALYITRKTSERVS